jgi:hypothetical protein
MASPSPNDENAPSSSSLVDMKTALASPGGGCGHAQSLVDASPVIVSPSSSSSVGAAAEHRALAFDLVRLKERVAALQSELSTTRAKLQASQQENARLKLQLSGASRQGRSRAGTAGSGCPSSGAGGGGGAASPLLVLDDSAQAFRPATPSSFAASESGILADLAAATAGLGFGGPSSSSSPSEPRPSSSSSSSSSSSGSSSMHRSASAAVFPSLVPYRERTGSAASSTATELGSTGGGGGGGVQGPFFRLSSIGFTKGWGAAGQGAPIPSSSLVPSSTAAVAPTSSALAAEVQSPPLSASSSAATTDQDPSGRAVASSSEDPLSAAPGPSSPVAESSDAPRSPIALRAPSSPDSVLVSPPEAGSAAAAVAAAVAGTAATAGVSSAGAATPGSPLPAFSLSSAFSGLTVGSLFSKPKPTAAVATEGGSPAPEAAAATAVAAASTPAPVAASAPPAPVVSSPPVLPAAPAASSPPPTSASASASTAFSASSWTSWFSVRPKFPVNAARLKKPAWARARSGSSADIRLGGGGAGDEVGVGGAAVARALQESGLVDPALDDTEAGAVARGCRLVALDAGDALTRRAGAAAAVTLSGSVRPYAVRGAAAREALLRPSAATAAGVETTSAAAPPTLYRVPPRAAGVLVASASGCTVVAVLPRPRAVSAWVRGARGIEATTPHDPVAALGKAKAAVTSAKALPAYVAALMRHKDLLNRIPVALDAGAAGPRPRASSSATSAAASCVPAPPPPSADAVRQAVADLVRETGVFVDGTLHELGGRAQLCRLAEVLLSEAEAALPAGGGGDGEDVAGPTTRGRRAAAEAAVRRVLVSLSRTVHGGDCLRLVSESLVHPSLCFLAAESGGPAQLIVDRDREGEGEGGGGPSFHLSALNCFRLVTAEPKASPTAGAGAVSVPRPGSDVIALVRCTLNEHIALLGGQGSGAGGEEGELGVAGPEGADILDRLIAGGGAGTAVGVAGPALARTVDIDVVLGP